MAQYGEVRVDFITFTTGVAPNEGNVTYPVSGIFTNPTFSGDVIISSGLLVSGSVNIDNNLTVSGNINVNNITATGDATVDGDGTIGGDLVVSGDAIISSGLTVSGSLVAPDLEVSGITVTGDGHFQDIYVGGSGTFSGALNAVGTALISGNADGGVYGSGYWKVPSGETGDRPGTALAGMMRYNTTLGTYEGHDGTTWGQIGGGATGSGGDQVFVLNEQTVTTTYTIPDQMNATSCGPITINDSVEVIIGDGENWSVV